MTSTTSRKGLKPPHQPEVNRKARLRVIQPNNTVMPVQDCGACKNIANCWDLNAKEEHIILNMLVCRIKRNIEVNRSAKLFLQMVRPKLKTFAKTSVRGTNIDLGVALADLESQTIEYIQQSYVMGEIAYILHYLFGQPNGVIRHFANNYARKTRKYEETHVLEDLEASDESAYDPYNPSDEHETDLTKAARSVIDDGVTLTLHEYRVLSFCLANATEAKRPLNGLHVYLSRTMKVVRARVTRIYKDASEKVAREVHGTNMVRSV